MCYLLKKIRVACIALLMLPLTSFAQQVNVGLEPFPPLINEDGSGYIIDMLNALTNESDIQFNFQLMTYARAKKNLQNGQVNLIGLIPQHTESEEFYRYGEELNWRVMTTVDLFSSSEKNIDHQHLANKTIGTLIGNEEFFAELLKIPTNKVVGVTSLQQLAMLVAKNRINIAIFERVSMMSTINQLKLDNIYYKKFTTLGASLAVQKTPQGHQLKTLLDKLLEKHHAMEHLAEYQKANHLADFGKVVP